MRPGIRLPIRILLLVSLNILALVGVFLVFVRVQFRLDPSSFFLAPARDRMLSVSRMLALELPQTDRSNWDQLLAHYSATYPARFGLYEDGQKNLAGAQFTIPPEVTASIGKMYRPPPEPSTIGERSPDRNQPPGPPPPLFVPDRSTGEYWAAIPIPIWLGRNEQPPVRRGFLIWQFQSFWTELFFFDYRPWVAVILAVIGISALCWVPFIRGLTVAIVQLTSAAERISEGQFDTTVSLRRRDEVGQLGHAISSMAGRLSGYVHGQKRFLGDIAHELSSPIARIQMALGILERHANRNQIEYVVTCRKRSSTCPRWLANCSCFPKRS